jgi:predicted esterase
MEKFFLFLSCFIFFFSFLQADVIEENISKEEGGYKYGFVLPVNFNPERKFLLGVCLHGLGGNGPDFAKRLGYYTRYMNIILACPNGNHPDSVRNSTKWGPDSPDYLFNFIKKMQSKYQTTGKVVLFGFSQGGNHGLNLSLGQPELFSHFIGISGGYMELDSDHLENVGKIKILLISGDKGAGEAYTKKALDARYKLLSKKGKEVYRKTIRGEQHELSPKLLYSAMRWYAGTNPFFKPNFWIFKGNYYPVYLLARKKFQIADYRKAMEVIRKSLKLNPVFPPSHLLYLKAALRAGSLSSVQKSVFMTLQFYSNDQSFDSKGIFDFFEEFFMTIQNDSQLVNYYIRLFSEKALEIEDTLLPVYSGEMYLFLTKLLLNTEDKASFLQMKEKAIYYFSQVPADDPCFSRGGVEKKLAYLYALSH